MRVSALFRAIDRLAKDADRLLVATDFDGTLCPITDSPCNVVIPPVILEIVANLSLSHRVAVTVISGRALDDLVRKVPLQIILAGNYGLAVHAPGFSFEHPAARQLKIHLTDACRQLSRVVAAWKGAWVEDKVLTAAVHYRNVDWSEHYSLMRKVRHCMAPYSALFGMRAGLQVVEIIPRIGWNKGSCLRWVRHKLNMETDEARCICIGSDPTDESMFVANANQLNIRVGSLSHTAARHRVSDVFEVAAVLAHIEQVMRRHSLETEDDVALSFGDGRS